MDAINQPNVVNAVTTRNQLMDLTDAYVDWNGEAYERLAEREFIEVGEDEDIEYIYHARSCMVDWIMAREYFDKHKQFRCDYPICDCVYKGEGGRNNHEAWREKNYASSFRHWVLHQSSGASIWFDLDNWSEYTFRDLVYEYATWENKKSGIGHINQPKNWSIPKLFLVKDSECYQETISKEVYRLVCDGIGVNGQIPCSICDQSCEKMWLFEVWGETLNYSRGVWTCSACVEQFSRCRKCSDETHGEKMHGDLYHFKSFEKRFGSTKNARNRQINNGSDLEPFNDERAMILV